MILLSMRFLFLTVAFGDYQRLSVNCVDVNVTKTKKKKNRVLNFKPIYKFKN